MEVREVRMGDPEYPPLLRELPDAAPLLYAAGRVLEPAPMVSVVGTRRASRYGTEVAGRIARGLAGAGLVVVSGMALGIDAAAHRGALGGGGRTVAVLGCGLDVCYPPANRRLRDAILEHGTLLSEHPAGVEPRPWHFPVRNRIIAGLSLGTVIVEARETGGALITARLASDLGREVFAVPGPVNADSSRGAHALVRDGARLVTCAADVLEDLGLGTLMDRTRLPLPGAEAAADPVSVPMAPAGAGVGGVQPSGAIGERSAGREAARRAPGGTQVPAGLGPDELRLLAVLEAEPLLLDAVALRVSLPISTAAAVLARLELSGLATRYPGGRFARGICL